MSQDQKHKHLHRKNKRDDIRTDDLIKLRKLPAVQTAPVARCIIDIFAVNGSLLNDEKIVL